MITSCQSPEVKVSHHEPAVIDKTHNNISLIPRTILFSNPQKAHVRVSPDGNQIAFLAPFNGVLNIWVAPVSNPTDATLMTEDSHHGIRTFAWAYTSEHILYASDTKGNEDFHIYSVNIKSKATKDLTPIDGIAARVQGVSDRYPEEILVAINDRDQRQLHDIYRVNIVSGKRTLVQINPGFAGFINDDEYRIRFGITFNRQADQLILLPDPEKGWKEYAKISAIDAMTTGIIGFDDSGSKVYFLDSRDRDTAALKVVDLNTTKYKILAEDERADISDILFHPKTKKVQAAAYTYTRHTWHFLDDAIEKDFAYLKTVSEGEVDITSRSLNDDVWTVTYTTDTSPTKFYLYNRTTKKAEFLFSSQPELAKHTLSRMHPVIIKSGDQLNLVSYLSLPVQSDPDGDGKPSKALPLVLLVHGGPWSRDNWGYNAMHQLLTNRGYAVLSVNFRGSTGFGKRFINAANGEWGARMQDDLLDAVDWAVTQNIAQKDKIAIMGGSYGGYAALVGVTKTPEVFACAVDIAGPSNLLTLLQNPPPYWMPFMSMLKQRVGDWSTEEGREFLESRSPLFFVENIRRPLLIGHGKHDPRVKQSEADQIANAMKERGIPVTYILFQDEGHGLARAENRLAFNAITESFLADCLGGHREKIGDAFDGAEFTTPIGKLNLPKDHIR